MKQSQKLNLFVGLGCKPMKDVICHWTYNDDVYIEAIPEKLNVDEQHKNVYDLWRRYRSILLEMKA